MSMRATNIYVTSCLARASAIIIDSAVDTIVLQGNKLKGGTYDYVEFGPTSMSSL